MVAELKKELATRGVSVNFTETVLLEEQMAESNLILFNGVPLEDVLDDATADENACASCSCLTGSDTSCRTVQYGGAEYEEIPPELIRRAALKALGLTNL